jgi:hypothetical protein
MAAKTTMTPITSSISTSVNPRRVDIQFDFPCIVLSLI